MAETNARKRPIGFVEASTVETDDFLLIDGQTSGTRKIKPDKVGKANTSDLNNDAGFQNASEVAAAIAANIDDGLNTAGKAADSKAVGDALATKVDAAPGKGLSANDYTTAEKTKLAGVATGATRVLIDSGLSESGKAADAAAVGTALETKANASETETALAGKVDKAAGKGLSTNDYTTAEKTKLAGIQDGAAAVDATLAITGKAADAKKTGDEITAIKTDLLEKADASGTSENLTAGNAEQLMTDKGITDKVPYLLRASGGNGADREEDKIVGGTVAWNQLSKTIDNTVTDRGITITPNSDGSVTLSQQSTGAGPVTAFKNISCFANHKYLIVPHGLITGLSVYTSIGGTITITGAAIRPENTGGTRDVTLRTDSDITYNNTKVYVNTFDLTQMFGTAIADRAYAMEQATAGSGIAWLKSMGFFRESYYPYDAGSLKSVEGLTAHRMVGFNQWDEEWELGGIDDSTGQKIAVATQIRSKNYIKCVPNTVYYATSPVAGAVYIYYYDANGNYIGRASHISTGYNVANKEFTTPSNCQQLMMKYQQTGVTSYNHDICINLSDPAKNGTYEPYKTWSYPLDSTLTLRGVLKLDENYQVYYDGDEYEADGTVKRNCKTKVLNGGSSESWLLFTGSGVNQFYVWVNDVVHVVNSVNVVSDRYSSISIEQRANNYGTCYTGEGAICFNISSSVASTVEAWLALIASNPITVVYRTTPTTEEADPFQNPQIVDPYGTEEYETTGIVPVGHETFYPENLRSKIEGLPFNFATLIAPTESTYKATRAYSANNLFIVDNILYKATTSIASGGTITPGTNCTATTLAEIIAALS